MVIDLTQSFVTMITKSGVDQLKANFDEELRKTLIEARKKAEEFEMRAWVGVAWR